MSGRVAILVLAAGCSVGLEVANFPIAARRPVAVRASAARLPAVLAAASTVPVPSAGGLAVGWGVCGFLSILVSAIKRLAPIAVQPLKARDMTLLQWALYAGMMAFFAYAEGYQAFQKKFSPMVVRRAMTLHESTATAIDVALAPFYSMGLFHATRKRKIVSWSMSTGVLVVVSLVKRLPYPWRSIVDAGVCVGLTWGGASVVAIYFQALVGVPPSVDPEMPPREVAGGQP